MISAVTLDSLPYVTFWIFHFTVPVSWSAPLYLFLLGLISFPLLFFSGRMIRNMLSQGPYGKALIAAAIAAPFTFLGLFFGVADSGSSHLVPLIIGAQSLALGIFAACVFGAACFAAHYRKGVGVLLCCALCAALLFSLLPPLFDIPSQFFAAAFSLIVAVLSLLCALISCIRAKKCRHLWAAAVFMFIIAVSLSVPVAELQILARSFSVLLILICWKPLPRTETDAEDGDSMAHNGAEEQAVDARVVHSFFPPEFTRLLNKRSIAELAPGDCHRQEMTVLCTGIRQPAGLPAHDTPEDSLRFINSCFTRVVPVIGLYGGFIDRYSGDTMTALFPQPNGAYMAVQASLEIQKRMHEYNYHRAKSGYHPLETGVGIHTGMFALGVVGVENRMQNTVISEAANLAGHIEGLTRTFGISTGVSGQTFNKLEHPGSYMFRYLGNVHVRESGEPLQVYELLNGIGRTVLERKIQTNRFFERGLYSLARKQHADALKNFTRVIETIPDDLAAKMYVEHCRERLKSSL
jgi:two-component system sensor histidine kinase ChiS